MHSSIPRVIYILSLTLLMNYFGPVSALYAEKKEPGKKEKLQQMYMTYLKASGYRPDLDSDGDVTFKHEGGNYIIQIHENDDGYFRLIYPNFWEIESEQEGEDVLVAGSATNSIVKCAKIFTVKDNLWAVVELFLTKPDDYEKLLARSISALQNGVSTFRTKMQELGEIRKKKDKKTT